MRRVASRHVVFFSVHVKSARSNPKTNEKKNIENGNGACKSTHVTRVGELACVLACGLACVLACMSVCKKTSGEPWSDLRVSKTPRVCVSVKRHGFACQYISNDPQHEARVNTKQECALGVSLRLRQAMCCTVVRARPIPFDPPSRRVPSFAGALVCRRPRLDKASAQNTTNHSTQHASLKACVF